MQPIVRLENLVGKFRIAEARLGGESAAYRASRQHIAHSEIATDAANEVDRVQFLVPGPVVDDAETMKRDTSMSRYR